MKPTSNKPQTSLPVNQAKHGMELTVVGPYRPDFKGCIERTFAIQMSTNPNTIVWITGKARKNEAQ
jgi:hypothetical protein